MRVIVTGGGTGGHIYPAIAIADKIREMEPDSEILYIGNETGLEKEIVPKAGYDFEMVTAMWLDRSHLIKIFKTGWGVLKGTAEARRIMKRFRPDVVIGTGGYVCVPVLLAGHQFGARTYLHEQNAYPGVANRFLERYVKHIFLGFPDAAKYFKEPEKLVDAGNPVRRSFFQLTREEARRKLGFPQDAFIILSFGGSLGAEKINEVAFDLMEAVNGQEKVMLIFGTGKWYYEATLEKAREKNIRIRENILIRDYIDPMDQYLAACDVVISRSGALSVAETTVCGKASVLIPSPNVTGNHQYYNAKAVADRGGAILMEEKDLTSEKLIEEVLHLKNHPEDLAAMSRASRACAPDRALDIIYDTIRKEI
ncbi:MAG: undecaprenyldiphospho-muramoylpentapeptide beta-N-acetylglucosaminyltransferase [Anaerovoracaceae bacterium]